MASLDLQQETHENNKNVMRDLNSLDNISLKCPKCKVIFTINDFENSDLSKAHFEQFVQKITENTKEQIAKEIEKKLFKKFQYDFDNNTKNLELLKNKEIAEQLSVKMNEFSVEKETLLKKFNDQLNESNTNNQDLKAKIENLELLKNKEIAEQLSVKMNEFSVEKETLLKKFNDQLNESNTNNQDLKAKIENLELLKNKEIAEQLSVKMNEFSVEKETLLKKFNDQLNESNTNNQDLKAKIENLELLKNKEIAEQLSVKMNEFSVEKETLLKKFNDELSKKNEEMHKLELENQKNKLVNNKIQGDNLEQEIEEELSKTFFWDSISKITSVGKKADLIQKVKIDGTDKSIATIAYEIKSTKEWNNNWETKFVDDMRKMNARYGIITATAFSIEYGKKIFAVSEFNPNIYFCSHENVALVAQIVRMFILTEYKLENSNKNNDLEDKISKLTEWKKIDFPSFSSKIKTSIEKLEAVKNAISNQISPLEKNIKIIKENFIDEIEKNLNLLIF